MARGSNGISRASIISTCYRVAIRAYREETNVYVGHYSEWRYLENVGRGANEGTRKGARRGSRIEIDVQKDQGLRESRGRGRRERENRVAKERPGREKRREKRREKESRTTSRVTSCRLPRVFSSSTFAPPGSSPRLVSSPPPCPRKHPRTFFQRSRFVFFVEPEIPN